MKVGWFLGSKRGQQKKSSYVKIMSRFVSEDRLNYSLQHIMALKQNLVILSLGEVNL